jgi:leucyl aminopeptidase
VTETIFLVGKGVTYDTGEMARARQRVYCCAQYHFFLPGGLDIKAGGIMAGMHRDKCGAAAVAGVMAALAITKVYICCEIVSHFQLRFCLLLLSHRLIQPQRVKFVGRMAMVRNSTGSDGYVADEILLSRSGKRVRVVNTDAEGRMAMADVLCQAKEEALAGAVNPRLLTIATLTGHAVRAVGEGYSIVMVNDPAKEVGVATRLQAAGDKMADPFEYSTVRREDWTMITPKYMTEDVVCHTRI